MRAARATAPAARARRRRGRLRRIDAAGRAAGSRPCGRRRAGWRTPVRRFAARAVRIRAAIPTRRPARAARHGARRPTQPRTRGCVPRRACHRRDAAGRTDPAGDDDTLQGAPTAARRRGEVDPRRSPAAKGLTVNVEGARDLARHRPCPARRAGRSAWRAHAAATRTATRDRTRQVRRARTSATGGGRGARGARRRGVTRRRAPRDGWRVYRRGVGASRHEAVVRRDGPPAYSCV